MNKVFVYGSLRRAFHNHSLLRSHNARFMGIDFIPGKLIDLGPFPGLIPGTKPVEGEIFLVSDACLASLDRLEGHPHFYQRKEAVCINSGERVSYYELQHVPIIIREIKSGVWKGEQSA